MSDGFGVSDGALAHRRIMDLRTNLKIEKSGKSVNKAVEDAAWELELSKNHTWRLYNPMKAGDALKSLLNS